MTLEIDWRGKTRIVILTKSYAFKICRLMPRRAVRSVCDIWIKKKNREYHQVGRGLIRIFMGTLLSGATSNLREWLYSTFHDDPRIFKCRFSIPGFLVVQDRGLPVRETPFKDFPDLLCDLDRPEQFCIHPDGGVKIVDYGRKQTIAILKSSRILEKITTQ